VDLPSPGVPYHPGYAATRRAGAWRIELQLCLAPIGGTAFCFLDLFLTFFFLAACPLLSTAQLILVCPFSDVQAHGDHGQSDGANGTPARKAQPRGSGHRVIACRVPGCGPVFYEPPHKPKP